MAHLRPLPDSKVVNLAKVRTPNYPNHPCMVYMCHYLQCGATYLAKLVDIWSNWGLWEIQIVNGVIIFYNSISPQP